MYWSSSSGRIELQITKREAARGSHPGQCDRDVLDLSAIPRIKRQLDKLNPKLVVEELREYGWSEKELQDHAHNIQRLLWVACCDIDEGNT